MKERILITGGAGFIGTHLSQRFIDARCEVAIIDCLLRKVHGDKVPEFIKGVQLIKADVINKYTWHQAASFKPTVIFHLAAETGTARSMDEIVECVDTNIKGTAQLVEFLHMFGGVKKIILTSSRAVYGESVDIKEDVNFLEPVSIYGMSKLMQEQMIKLSLKVPWTIFRLQNVYGPGQSLLNPYTGLISIFAKQLKQNAKVEIYDTGVATRDFIYIDDVIDALFMSGNSEKTDYQTFNVGTGIQTTIKEIAEKLKFIMSSHSDIIVTKHHRPGDILHARGNIEKIQHYLGWAPKTDIHQGLINFVNWFNEKK